MTYPNHLLQLKSLLLIQSSTCVLQQHVPGLRERAGRAAAIHQQLDGVGEEPVRAKPDEMLSAFIFHVHKFGAAHVA